MAELLSETGAGAALRAVVGVGIDLVDVHRLARILAAHGEYFTRLAFTALERAESAACADRPRALAMRFAAKEAFFKALGTGWGPGRSLRDVEVRTPRWGFPSLWPRDRVRELVEASGVRRIHLTLFDAAALAGAIVLLEA